jgi:hypothetical protein
MDAEFASKLSVTSRWRPAWYFLLFASKFSPRQVSAVHFLYWFLECLAMPQHYALPHPIMDPWVWPTLPINLPWQVAYDACKGCMLRRSMVRLEIEAISLLRIAETWSFSVRDGLILLGSLLEFPVTCTSLWDVFFFTRKISKTRYF